MTHFSKLAALLLLWLICAAFAIEQEEQEISRSCLTRVMERTKITATCTLGSIKWSLCEGGARVLSAKDFSTFLWGIADFAIMPLKALKVGLSEMFSPWQQPKISRNANFVCPIVEKDRYAVDEETKDHVIATYQLMKDIDEAFHETGIPYFATCGTLLGCVRHRGFIPSDDDLDIVVTEEYAKSMPQVLNALHQKRYKAVATKGMLGSLVALAKRIFSRDIHSAVDMSNVAGLIWAGWRVERWFDQPKVYGKETVPFCDIFLMKRAGDRYYYANGGAEYSFHKDIVYPLKKAKFGALTISVPHQPHVFLDIEYQENWPHYTKKFNHDYGNHQIDFVRFSAKLEKMCYEDYLPAGPFWPLR